MATALRTLIHTINDSGVHDGVTYLLANVPGLPPIVQTVHLLGIACIMVRSC